MTGEKLKILIVDDEPFSRKRILAFPLKDCCFEIVGEAENGQDALVQTEKLHPDIIVTDIVMPVMDGLQLLAEINQKANHPEVVILTCYDEFEKAQAALRLGAQDYIIKLMLREEAFISSINRVATKILKRRQVEFQNRRKIMENLLQTDSKAYQEQYIRQLQESGADVFYYRIVMMSCHDSLLTLSGDGWYAVERWNAAEGLCCLVPKIGNDYFFLILYTQKNFFSPREFEQETAAFCSSLYNSLDGQCRLIVGKTGSKASGLCNAYHSLLKCKERLFYTDDEGGILFEEQVKQLFQSFPAAEFQLYSTAFRQAIHNGDGKEAGNCLLLWLTDIKTKYRPMPDEARFLLYIFSAAITDNYTVMHQNGSEMPLQRWLVERAKKADSIHDLTSAVEEAVRVLQSEDCGGNSCIRKEIRGALEYIGKNYRTDISLQMVAEHVKLSESWFGALFKAEVGQSFSEYLIRFRLSRAKLLLTDTEQTINQISDNVGIVDPHYFSRVFTKIFGQSPKEYRKACHDEGNKQITVYDSENNQIS